MHALLAPSHLSKDRPPAPAATPACSTTSLASQFVRPAHWARSADVRRSTARTVRPASIHPLSASPPASVRRVPFLVDWFAQSRVCTACLPGTYAAVLGSSDCTACPV